MAAEVMTAPEGRIIHKTYAVLSGAAIPQRVHVTQYDESLPVIACTLYKDGQLYTIPDGASVRLRMNKNGLPVYHEAIGIDDARHVVYLEITAQMTVLYGEFAMVLEVETSDGKTAGTSYLRLIVRQNPVQNPELDNIPDYTANSNRLTAEGVKKLQDESSTQQKAIEDKGKNTLESIPADYSTLSGKVDENTSRIRELKEDLADYDMFIGKSNFTVINGTQHSSTKDTIKTDFKNGEIYIIDIKLSAPITKGNNTIQLYHNGSFFMDIPMPLNEYEFSKSIVATNDVTLIGFYVALANGEIDQVSFDIYVYKIDGLKDNLDKSVYVKSRTFYMNKGEVHSSTKDRIQMFAKKDKTVYAFLKSKSSLVGDLRGFGTDYKSVNYDTLESNKFKEVTLTCDTIEFGTYISSATEDTDITLYVFTEDNILSVFKEPNRKNYEELDTLEKSFGIRVKTISVPAGAYHSSTKDSIPLPNNKGMKCYLYAYSYAESAKGLQLEVFARGNGSTSLGTFNCGKIKEIDIPSNYDNIGIYVPQISEDADYNILVSFENNIIFDLIENSQLFVSSEYNHSDNIDSAIEQYSSLLVNGSESDSYLFFTDPHIFQHIVDEEKMKKAIGTLEYAFNNTPTQMVLCGGDWLQDSDTQSEASTKLGRIDGIMRSKFGNRYYPILGNHDTNYQGVDNNGNANSGVLQQKALKNLWFRNYTAMYYDFKTENTRYYCFDTGTDWENDMTDYRWKQIDWFANAVNTNDDKHSAIALHIFTNQSKSDAETALNPQNLAKNITIIAQAYNNKTTITLNGKTYDFTSTSGKVSYLICGHSHYDANFVYNDIPVIITTKCGYIPNFDLVYADYDKAKLEMVRIGNGESRSIDIIS